MSVRVEINHAGEEGVTVSEMEPGVLYLDASLRNFRTIYTKNVNGDLIWFEKDNIGHHSLSSLFVKAPKGTRVILEN